MKTLSLFIVYFLISNAASLQNLVLNPDFEERLYYQDGLYYDYKRDFPAKNWHHRFDDAIGTPDYYTKDSKDFEGNINLTFGVPVNRLGNHPAHSGNSYAGLGLMGQYINKKINTIYTEILTGTLSQALEEGKTYEIEFYVRHAGEYANFFSYKIEMIFHTDGKIFEFSEKKYKGFLRNEFLSVDFFNKRKICACLTLEIANTQTPSWIKVSGTYTANGGEQFFSIGLFCQDKSYKRTIKKFKRRILKNQENHQEIINQYDFVERRIPFLKNNNINFSNFRKKSNSVAIIYYFIDSVSIKEIR